MNAEPGNHRQRLIRLPEVLGRIGYKRSRFLELVRQGIFPKPIKLGARAVAWPESVIDDLVDSLIAGKGVDDHCPELGQGRG